MLCSHGKPLCRYTFIVFNNIECILAFIAVAIVAPGKTSLGMFAVMFFSIPFRKSFVLALDADPARDLQEYKETCQADLSNRWSICQQSADA